MTVAGRLPRHLTAVDRSSTDAVDEDVPVPGVVSFVEFVLEVLANHGPALAASSGAAILAHGLEFGTRGRYRFPTPSGSRCTTW